MLLIKSGLLKRMRIGLSTSSIQPLQFCDSAKGKSFEVWDGVVTLAKMQNVFYGVFFSSFVLCFSSPLLLSEFFVGCLSQQNVLQVMPSLKTDKHNM